MHARTREELAHYLARHPDEHERLHALRAQIAHDDDIFSRANMAGHITSSVLVFDADRRHVLLIHHKVYQSWMQPGGHVEPDSASLFDSGLREVEEETGLPAADTQPLWEARALDIDTHAIAARPAKGEGAHRHHDVLFAVVATRPFTPRPQLEEVNGVEWMPIADFLALPGRRMQHLVPKLRALLDPAPAAAPRNAPFDPNR